MNPQTLPVFIGSFLLICVASREIGHYLGRFNLPHITGYLLIGALAGPFLLNLLPAGAVEQLRFVDELSLAVIAFIAGSELYLKELRSRIRPILVNIAGVAVAAFLLIGGALFLLTSSLPFIAENGVDIAGRLAVALLGATILLALSPPSTIAVIQEMRARGPFTKTVLSTTVVMDVVIIILFAISAALAGTLLAGKQLSVDFVALLALDLLLAVLSGYLIGRLLEAVLSTGWSRLVKMLLVLLIGMMIFSARPYLVDFSKNVLGLSLHVESLLVAMIGGFFITNFTSQRAQFDSILHQVSPWVYVAFFTLTGIGLKLDILLASIGISLILFIIRMIGIYIGSFVGSTLVNEPPPFRRLYGLGLITQAGIALGLAREVSAQFPDTLGTDFATLILSVVVLNEIFGPLFLKFALRRAGEAQEPEGGPSSETRDAVILGVEPQSLLLARQLTGTNWRVILADTDESHVERMVDENVDERHLPAIDAETLASIMSPETDALVAMLSDDDQNYLACEIAFERFGIKRLIVRLNDLSRAEEFKALGALVVDDNSAMVNLIHQAVRAPQSAALFMHSDPEYDIIQITITNRDFDGMLLRDLRLPNDVLIVEVARNGHAVVPSGYTRLNYKDEVTLIGRPASLEEITLKLGY